MPVLFVQVKSLNRRVCELMGFDKWIPVSGQTYTRKIDYQVSKHKTHTAITVLFVIHLSPNVCLCCGTCLVLFSLQVLTVLSGLAQSAYKMCGDVRLLANLKEVEEPFAKTQVRYPTLNLSNLPPTHREGYFIISSNNLNR